METAIGNGVLKVLIRHKGAEMVSVKNSGGLEYIWEADDKVWPRHAPVLFPVVGKLKNDSYSFKGNKYNLGQHGFARDKEFELLEKSKTSCSFRLMQDEDSRNKFPFDFTLDIKYELDGNSLVTAYTVKNTSAGEMYFSIGAHPGFRCPILPDERYEDYFLEFEKQSCMQSSLQDGLRRNSYKLLQMQGNRVYLSENLFNEDALVFEHSQISNLSLRSSKSNHAITMECPGWPYFGIWAKKGSKRFVCLEPWYGVADSVESGGELQEKEGIIRLAGGAEFNCSFTISFSW